MTKEQILQLISLRRKAIAVSIFPILAIILICGGVGVFFFAFVLFKVF